MSIGVNAKNSGLNKQRQAHTNTKAYMCVSLPKGQRNTLSTATEPHKIYTYSMSKKQLLFNGVTAPQSICAPPSYRETL